MSIFILTVLQADTVHRDRSFFCETLKRADYFCSPFGLLLIRGIGARVVSLPNVPMCGLLSHRKLAIAYLCIIFGIDCEETDLQFQRSVLMLTYKERLSTFWKQFKVILHDNDLLHRASFMVSTMYGHKHDAELSTVT